MNTKEAIKFLDENKNSKDKYAVIPPNRLGIDETLDDIVTLLQRGEAYEKMWEELEELIENNTFLFTYDVLLRNMKSKLKQKYCPKEVNK